jgi:hypothetical protein
VERQGAVVPRQRLESHVLEKEIQGRVGAGGGRPSEAEGAWAWT